MTPRRLQRCEQHEINNLPYLAFHEDAEIRTERGERQYKCAECGLWQWPRLEANARSIQRLSDTPTTGGEK